MTAKTKRPGWRKKNRKKKVSSDWRCPWYSFYTKYLKFIKEKSEDKNE